MKYHKKSSSIASQPVLVLLGVLVVLLLLFISLRNQRADRLPVWVPDVRVTIRGGSSEPTASASIPNDKLLGGLLSPDFHENTCLSRYQSMMYRKASPHILSSYLISKLRNYESLHKKCAPNTPLFQKSIEQLKSNHSNNQSECNYILWSPLGGIGNRMLTFVSTFLYALLTNRVMLVQNTADMDDMFCEPFPGSTWYLPSDFPVKNFEGYNFHSQNSYGHMVENKLINDDPKASSVSLPPFVYVHLQYNYRDHGSHARFFCENDQQVISKVNWVLMKSDNYIVPGLFMIPKYEDELARMFPLKETVFHHLGRYLLHPSNSVWGMIMRYHNSYLAKANERIGIQARIFRWAPISIDNMYEQIINCTTGELVLPNANLKESKGVASQISNEVTKKTVLVASLHEGFYEKLKDLYYAHSMSTGEIISVYQPTHEVVQQTEEKIHNQKALAEIWLLSFSDVLVTTAGSTFGYVSYSLAGIKSWILHSSKDQKVPDPPCHRAMTIDPCFHSPPNFNCKTGSKADTGKMVPHVRQCDDFEQGVKLYD
ncbi:hypothetical protein LUZ60_002731 [Juncus effusus]|nr:hypothetical protein LUZ60_002731 [Juncus effusus]